MTVETRQRAVPQSLVPAPVRIATAIAIAGVLAAATMGAQQASREAVRTKSAAISNGPTYVLLAPVQVVGRRDAVEAKRS